MMMSAVLTDPRAWCLLGLAIYFGVSAVAAFAPADAAARRACRSRGQTWRA